MGVTCRKKGQEKEGIKSEGYQGWWEAAKAAERWRVDIENLWKWTTGGKMQQRWEQLKELIQKSSLKYHQDVFRNSIRTAWGARLFLAACVKCVSLDTGSIPPEINPWAPIHWAPTLLRLSPCPAYSSVWVWAVLVCVYGGWGLLALHRSTCRGQQKRETQNVRKGEQTGQQACQSRPSLSE